MSSPRLQDTQEAELILAELVRIEDEIASIATAGRMLAGASEWEIDPFRKRLIALKQLLKAYAKCGSLDLKRKLPTSAERKWFSTPVLQASSHFHMRTNAGPRHWQLGLSEVGMDISWAVSRLRKEIDGP